MKPLRLTDSQLDHVMLCARPLAPSARSAFLEDVARALSDHDDIGDGAVARAARDAQRKYFDPPALGRSAGLSRWARRGGGIRRKATAQG